MTCDRWLEPLSAAADGELGDGEVAALDAHLQRCDACNRLAERYSTMRRRLLVGIPVDVPDLEHAIVSRRTDELRSARTLRRRGAGVLVAAAAVVALLAGLTGPAATSGEPGTERAIPAPETRVVRAEATTFSDPDLRVPTGSSVSWLNDSGTEHHLVRRVGGTTLAQDLEPGQTEVITFDDPGVYRYWCSIHDGMSGRVRVGS